jgi:AcrR family transcriptional regulator
MCGDRIRAEERVRERLHSATGDERPALGLRERAKLERLRRIKQAARELFREKGYSATTTREIAARAEVAYGTLFAYTRDKRDLLMMLVNDDLDALTVPALEAIPREAPLVEQLIGFFRPRVEYWASEPEFSRYAVREMFEFATHGEDTGDETARFRRRRTQLVRKLTELVARKQEDGRIDRSEDPEMIAWLFLAIYLSENRQWLENHREHTDLVLGRLRRLLSLAIRGIAAGPEEWGGSSGRP